MGPIAADEPNAAWVGHGCEIQAGGSKNERLPMSLAASGLLCSGCLFTRGETYTIAEVTLCKTRREKFPICDLARDIPIPVAPARQRTIRMPAR